MVCGVFTKTFRAALVISISNAFFYLASKLNTNTKCERQSILQQVLSYIDQRNNVPFFLTITMPPNFATNQYASSPLTHCNLPVEVAERIIDYLGDQKALRFHDAEASQQISSTLLNCALVCRALYTRSMRNLYCSVRLDPEDFSRHGKRLLRTIQKNPDINRCVRSWAICELSSTSSAIPVMLRAIHPNSSARVLHLIGCQDMLDSPIFFKTMSTFRRRLTFLSLLDVTLTTTNFFRLLSVLPNITFLVISHNLIKNPKRWHTTSTKRPECRLQGLIIRTVGTGDDSEATLEALLHYPELLSSLDTLIVAFHPTWIKSKPMDLIASIFRVTAPTLMHAGLSFGESDYDDVTDVSMYLSFPKPCFE